MSDTGPNQPHLFMIRARRRLSPNAYAHLTQIIGMFTMQTITRSAAHAQAAALFVNHPELLEDFREYIPEEEPRKSILGRVQRSLKKFKNKVTGGRKSTR